MTPEMKLRELIDGLPISGLPAADVEVLGINHDSRRVEKGDLFVGLIGGRFDGRVFADQAADRGAVAVLSQGSLPGESGLPWLSTHEPRHLLGPLAARLYEHPDREMRMVGVTGTNGKSTVVALIAGMLEAAGRPTGTIGTLGYRFGDMELEAQHTTPEASDLFRTLRRMLKAGAEAVAMEVSSHGLAQQRVANAGFDVAVFTNLTRDHFDFHQDFEDYFSAKRKLFQQLKPSGRAVVNLDDAYGRRLVNDLANVANLANVVSFGDHGDVRPGKTVLDELGIRGVVGTPRGDFEFESPLLGRYNLHNVLAAIAAGEALELDHQAMRDGLARVSPLPGRMESVGTGQPFPVYIDFAHTDAALEAALRSLRELSSRKIVLVFGCGGDRDPGKRALMGRVAGSLAEMPIVTSDNPRGEDPLSIIGAVEVGLKESGCSEYRLIADRRQAIAQAVQLADTGWCVLVAGKGHERVQVIGDQTLPFSDREEIERALDGLGATLG